MPNKCSVPFCKTGYKPARKDLQETLNQNFQNKRPILFSVPKDPERLNEWNRNIHRKDRNLTTKDFVCELHFVPDCISRFTKHKLPNGTVQTVEKKPTLLPDAVPTIIPGAPSYLSDTKKNIRKSPKKRPSRNRDENAAPLHEKQRLSDEVMSTSSQNIDATASVMTFEKLWHYMLSKSINNWIKQWLISKTPNGDSILLIKISEDVCEKKIVVDTELKVTVSLRDVKVVIENLDRISTTTDFDKLIFVVDTMKHCMSLEIPFQKDAHEKCLGFVSTMSRSKYCSCCSELKRIITRKKRRFENKCTR